MTKAVSTTTSAGVPHSLFGYEVIGFLGEGAGSLIYAVSSPDSGQLYALKHVIVKEEKHVRFVDQVANEFEVSKHVRHPRLRKAVDLKVVKSLLRKPTEAALILEMFEGTASDAIALGSVDGCADIMRQTCEGLHAMHQQGYVHCDLKPNNILVSSTGEVKIIDLGQACPAGEAKKRIQGTPDFIAPEQVRCEPVSVQTDVYNLGATFYWMLTQRKMPTLFTLKKGDNSFLVADAIPTPTECNPAVPQNFSSLIMECCRTTVAKRPRDMAEVLRRLDIIQATTLKSSLQPQAMAGQNQQRYRA